MECYTASLILKRMRKINPYWLPEKYSPKCLLLYIYPKIIFKLTPAKTETG
jgi:hypothetical protein